MAEAAPEPDRRSPQSVTRVVRILDALCAAAAPVSLAELSRTLGSPKSSVAALLRGLADAGLAIGSEGHWRLGPGAFALGSALVAARRRDHSSDLLRAGMRRLAERSGETVLLAVPDADRETLTYVDIVESRNAVRFSVAIGDRRPLQSTAGGRALLAGLPQDRLDAWLKRLRNAAERQHLAEVVAAARDSGVAQTVDVAAEGVTGTAALIRDALGSVLGALVVAAPTGRLEGRRADLAALVRDEAAALSRDLGYRA